MITTERLVLRQWRSEDFEAYAHNMTDASVADWLGGVQKREAALATVQRLAKSIEQNGYGRFAIERRADGTVIGAAGICPIAASIPFAGEEIGWHLRRDAWGFGFASEAAEAILRDGFSRLKFPEVVAFTADLNVRSRAVMERLGMRRDESRDFDHPALAADHPLSRHVVYVATAD